MKELVHYTSGLYLVMTILSIVLINVFGLEVNDNISELSIMLVFTVSIGFLFVGTKPEES